MSNEQRTLGYCIDIDCCEGFVGATGCDVCDGLADTVVNDWTLREVLEELMRPKSHRTWGTGLVLPALGLSPEMTVAELGRKLAIAERVEELTVHKTAGAVSWGERHFSVRCDTDLVVYLMNGDVS